MVFLTNCPPPTEGIRHQQTNTTVDIDGKDLGKGTLFISESSVTWQKESDGGLGFSLLYPGISLHAISRDLTAYPYECLYLMLDGKLPGTEAADSADGEEDEDEESESKVTEIRFVPSDSTSLEAMYSAMSACQALHPDPEDVESDDDGEFDDYEEEEEEGEGQDEQADSGLYEGEEGLGHLTAEGQARLAQMDAMLEAGQGDGQRVTNGVHRPIILTGDTNVRTPEQPMDVGQFQDAEEME